MLQAVQLVISFTWS